MFALLIAFAAFFTKPQSAFSQDDLKQKIDSIISSLEGVEYVEREVSYFDVNKLIMKSGGKEAESLFKYALSRDSSDQAKMVFFESM